MSATNTVPPQNIEAEEKTLGGILINEPVMRRVIDEVVLEPGDFYISRHEAIFACVLKLDGAGKSIDAVAVADVLTKKQCKEFEPTGLSPRDYIQNLLDKTGAPSSAKHHAEIVQKASRLRSVIDNSRRAQEAAFDGELNGQVDQLVTALETVKSGAAEITTVKASDVTLRSPRFLDEAQMIPMRSVSITVGKAGLGKTMFAINRCAAVTLGKMPGLDGKPAPVLISSQEDDAEAVLAPRAVAAGADLGLIHFVSGLTLPSQVPALMARAKTLGAALIVIDPIGEHLDTSVDSHKDAAVRAALRPLGEGAQELDLAVLVVCHPNKNSGASGLDRISGSGAFGNAARSVIVFGLDPGDPDGETGDRRIIAHLKCNVGRRAPSIAAEIATKQVMTEDGAADVPRLRITGLSEHSADDILASPSGEEKRERDEASDFLTEHLAGGPVRSKEIIAAAGREGISKRTLERAKKDLGLKAAQGGDGWYWLPEGRTEL